MSVAASDIFGVSGRAMMSALIAGERDPKALAQLARSGMRTKITLHWARRFTGHFGEHRAFLLIRMLAHLASWTRFAPGIKESAGKKKAQARPGTATPTWRRFWVKPPWRQPDRHLPRTTLSAHSPQTRQEESHRRGQTLHPHHRLTAAVQPRRPVPRPRPRLLRQPHQRQSSHPQPHRRTRRT